MGVKALITLYKKVTGGALNFQMTALCFVNVIKKMISMLEENSIPKKSKDAT